jgi:Zn-dependent protease with chaperone function
MSSAAFGKCACSSCGQHLEFPIEATGSTVACPACQAPTALTLADEPPAAVEPMDSGTGDEPAPHWSVAQIAAAFSGPVPRTRVSILYQAGLCLVTFAMALLPLIYLAMIAAAGWGVYFWARHFSYFLDSSQYGGRVYAVRVLFLYGTPLFIGLVLVFFMVKPLFAPRPRYAKPLALNPGAEPLLFMFISKVCETVGAPFPKRIDVNCQLNASASFRRGAFSFLGHDLVLTIGLPLVGSLSVRDFAGVMAHEFGHFAQGFGMRLTYIIHTVNNWFARVVYERDAWDLLLEEWAQNEDARLGIIVGFARLAVWFSRQLLTLLMLLGHAIGCFMLRQMEYDADSYQIKVTGSESLERSLRRFHVLGTTLERTYKDIRTSWNLNHHLPDDLPAYLLRHDEAMTAHERTRMEDTMGLEPTGLLDTHPSNGDRIRRARQAGDPGVFTLDGPATALFSHFDIPARQVTLLHYQDDLGLPLEIAKLQEVPAARTSELPVEG